MEKNIELKDVLDLNVLQKIQDSFAESTGLAAIVVDKEGNPLLEYSNFTDYCLSVRKTKACKDCFHSDAQGGFQAAESLSPQVYLCHAGLVDLAVPIFVDDQYVGAILAGQVRVEPEIMEILQSDPELNLCDRDLLLRNKHLRNLYDDTHISTFNRVKQAAKLLFTLANYLTEMAHVNMMQQDLHEKDLALSEETRLRSEVEAALKEADLKALQAQINPHFLFNVLNTIGRLALLEGADRTQEMIYQFSDLMRYNLKRDSTVAEPLSSLISYVETYLSIQKMRLGDRLRYSIDVDPAVSDVMCPVMTIQPFIENAINYVVEPRSAGGSISVSAFREEGHATIIIRDDGPGMSQELVDSLLDGSYRSGQQKNTGIGINNVNKRLKYYFGQEYGIRINSTVGEGTEVVIRIPETGLSE
ncbi:MAG: sensor histidine kinase [Eubacteriaceae bacterium]